MTVDIKLYAARIHEELPGELVEAIGLDISGRDGDSRFPYTWAGLSDRERSRALSLFPPGPRADATPKGAPGVDTAGIAQAARDLSDILYRVEREWEALLEGIEDDDQRDAVRRALEQGYPLGKSLDDASAEAGEWAERIADLAQRAPSVMSLAAAELADDVDAAIADIRKRDSAGDVDEVYREMVNGGLGGVSGRVAGIFTPTVISALAALMQQIHHTDDGPLGQVAYDFACAFRAARRASRDY